jgi:hypothetical protein
MSRKSEFEDILDGCVERLLAGEATVEDCLAAYPQHAAELEPLLRTAVATSRALDFSAGEEVKERSLSRFRLELAREDAAARRGAPRRSLFGWQPRWAMVVVVVLAVVLAGGGTVLAAESSMPGNPLYTVKLATERLRVALAGTNVQKARVQAALTDRRVAELAYIVSKGNARQVEQATQRYSDQVAAMSRLSLAARPVEERQVTPDDSQKEPDSPSLAPREATAEALDGRNGRLKLRVLLGQYIVNHPAQFRELLQKAPETTRPALQKAITESVEVYKRTLEQLERLKPLPSDEPSTAEPNTSSDVGDSAQPSLAEQTDSPARTDTTDATLQPSLTDR